MKELGEEVAGYASIVAEEVDEMFNQWYGEDGSLDENDTELGGLDVRIDNGDGTYAGLEIPDSRIHNAGDVREEVEEYGMKQVEEALSSSEDLPEVNKDTDFYWDANPGRNII